MSVFLFVLGAAFGSFMAALTYRLPEGISISRGRSFCPRCRKPIAAYDNIPLFSYIILGGKCRQCKRPISKRYFPIELSTALLFTFAYIFYDKISANMVWINSMSKPAGLFVLGIIILMLVGIFVVDMEHQFIPDEFIFIGFLTVFLGMLLSDNNLIYLFLLAGFSTSGFLLLIHLITRGNGMGLGDVKLAIFIGFLFGFPLSPIWMFSAFVLGSLVGVALLASKKAKIKQRIAFGPFLVAAAFVVAIYGNNIVDILFPYLYGL